VRVWDDNTQRRAMEKVKFGSMIQKLKQNIRKKKKEKSKKKNTEDKR
jgi:hypothetical protein